MTIPSGLWKCIWARLGALGLLVLVALGGTAPAQAQSDDDPRYTMMFRGVALDQALSRVAETTHINLVYDADLVAEEQVYCSARDAAPEALLECLLSDVGIDYYQTSAGTYVLTSSPRQSPRRGTLTGVVVDRSTGEPLSHANVLLASANTGVASNRAGRFRVADVQSGSHEIVTTHLGYEAAVDSVQVSPGDSTQYRIMLAPKPIQSEPVIVEGVERYAPAGALGSPSVAGAELTETGRLGTADAFRQAGALMGVHQQEPVADLHVQGGAAGEHEVRLDGMPIRNPVTLRRLLGAFSPLALDRLTVHKAGFGVEHGSTISGVVTVDHALSASEPTYGSVTVDPMSINAEGHGSVQLGTQRSAQIRVAARSSVWDVYRDPTLHQLLLDWNVVDPMLLSTYFGVEEAYEVTPTVQTAGVNFSDVHAAARVDLTPYTSLSVSGYRGRNRLETQFVAREPTSMLTKDQYRWANSAGQARLDWTLGARSSLALQLRGSEHRVRRGYQMTYGAGDTADDTDAVIDSLQRALSPGNWPDDQNLIREWTLETVGSYAAANRHQLEGAVDVSRFTSRFRLGGRFFRPTSLEDTRWQIGGYLRDVVSLGTTTTLTAGTRLTYIPGRQTLYAEPRVQLHQEGSLSGLGPYVVRVAGGLYRQFVNRFEVSSTSPTAILPSMRFWLPTGSTHAPPRSYHATTQIQVQPLPDWTMRGEAFYKHYGHLLIPDYVTLRGVGWAGPGESTAVAPADAITGTNGYALGGGAALTRNGSVLRTTVRYDWNRSRRRFPARFDNRLVSAPWNQPHRLAVSQEVMVTDALRLHVRGQHDWGRRWAYRQTYYDYLGLFPSADDLEGVSFGSPDSDPLPPRTRFDVGVEYNVQWKGAGLEARLHLLNVLDRQNPFDRGLAPTDNGLVRTTRRLPGRRVVGSIRARY